MGMIGCFFAVNDADLEAILEKPSRFHKLMERGEHTEIKLSVLGKIFGKKPVAAPPDPWKPAEPPEEFDIDKAWHGIHFLLTGTQAQGDGPLAFILVGGREIPEDMDYAAPRGFSATEVKEIAAALRKIDIDLLYASADPATFAANDIYPGIWDEPKEECIGYLTESLGDLREFIARIAEQNRALIVYRG